MKIASLLSFIIFIIISPIAQSIACSTAALNMVGSNGNPGICCDEAIRPGAGQINCFMPADTYNFTMLSFGFEDSTGNIIEFGSEQTFNGAGANVGENMGSFVAGSILPKGTYVAVLPKIRSTFTVGNNTTYPGGFNTGSGDACAGVAPTANNVSTIGGGMPDCSANPQAAECTSEGGTVMRIRDTALGNIVIDTSPVTINFNFDASAGTMYTYTSAGVCTVAGSGMGPLAVNMTKS